MDIERIERKTRKKSQIDRKSQKPSIINEYFYIYVFCSLTDRETDKSFIEYLLIYQMNLKKKYKGPYCK